MLLDKIATVHYSSLISRECIWFANLKYETVPLPRFWSAVVGTLIWVYFSSTTTRIQIKSPLDWTGWEIYTAPMWRNSLGKRSCCALLFCTYCIDFVSMCARGKIVKKINYICLDIVHSQNDCKSTILHMCNFFMYCNFFSKLELYDIDIPTFACSTIVQAILRLYTACV